MDGDFGQSVEIGLFRLWLRFYRSAFRAVSQVSAVRTCVLTDTVECQESRFAGLTSLTGSVKLRHYRIRSLLVQRKKISYLVPTYI
jgi:hypothetical protein